MSSTEVEKGRQKKRDGIDWLDVFGGGIDLEGVVVLALLGLAVGAAWLLAELVVPVVILAAYWLVLRGLARVANDDHDCEGSLGRALLWGVTWATVYTAPLALVVWVVHVVLAKTR